MLKYIVAVLCGVSLCGSVYMAGWGSQCQSQLGDTCDDSGSCCTPSAQVMAISSAKVDVKNTKCIVTGEDVGTSTETVEYQGKLYHICCHDCVADFNKTPETAAKFVKALEADPGKFGVKGIGE